MGPVDAVLLSHDQHADNLDRAGRAFLAKAPLTLTTSTGAARLAEDGIGLRGLAPWQHVDLPRDGREPVRVTAVPARHGPEGAEPISGEVTGFVLTAPDLPTIYISGDNAWLGAVEQVASRFGTVDIALLFAGAARIAGRFDGALLTLDSDLAAEAARVLGARSVVPVHYVGWQHFTEGGTEPPRRLRPGRPRRPPGPAGPRRIRQPPDLASASSMPRWRWHDSRVLAGNCHRRGPGSG